MDKQFLQLLLQFLTAMVNKQVDDKVKKGLTQGFVAVESDKDLDQSLQEAQVALADHVGCDVCDLDVSVA